MSCSYCDGWPLSVSSSVIDICGNSSECNQTSETLNTHVHTYTWRPCRLKGCNSKCQSDKCQQCGLGGFTSGVYVRDPLLNSHVCFAFSLSLILLFSSLFFRRFWVDLMRQSSDLMLSFSRSSAIRILFCQQERTQG